MGLDLVLSFVLTWAVGLLPPILIRFVFMRRPIEKAWAIGVVFLLWLFNVIFFTALGSQSKTHAALFLVSCVSYAILRRGGKLQAATNNFEFITDGETRSVANTEKIKSDNRNLSTNPIMILSLVVISISLITIIVISLDLASKNSSIASKQTTASVQESATIYQGNQISTGSPDEGVRTLQLKAEQGDVVAQNSLGLMYYQGRGVPQDDRKALKWFWAAAAHGYGTAQNNLGFMYRNGRGGPQDDLEAVKWYRLAAEQGDLDGQYNLGLSYQEGRGVIQSNEKAYAWWSVAATSGDSMAQKELEVVYNKMTPSQVERGQQLAKEIWERTRK